MRFLIFIISFVVFLHSKCSCKPSEWYSSLQSARGYNVLEQRFQNEWQSDSNDETKPDPVTITLYYETLCPYCRVFTTNQLWKAFNDVGSIMNIVLVPYGNAYENYIASEGTWNFTCQHGPDECYGNLFHTCLIYHYPDASDYLPFINCMESNDDDTIQDAAVKCGKTSSIDLRRVYLCMNSKYGNLLQKQNSIKTKSVSPPVESVPWITVNGVRTDQLQDDAQNDLTKLVCQTYKGNDKPDACNQYQ